MPPPPGARVLPLRWGGQRAVPPALSPTGCCMLTSVCLVSSLHSWRGGCGTGREAVGMEPLGLGCCLDVWSFPNVLLLSVESSEWLIYFCWS